MKLVHYRIPHADASSLGVVVEDEVIDIEIDDPRLLLNINTPEDYARFTKPSSKNFDAAAMDAPGAKSL